MYVREFRIGEKMELQAVFYSAVHKLASQDYTAEQINAWAPGAINKDRWIQKMRNICPLVVEDKSQIIAYADIQMNGYIDHFFVSAPHARRGVGTILMKHIIGIVKNKAHFRAYFCRQYYRTTFFS